MPYSLGGKAFPTKKAVTEHVRRVRESTDVGQAVTDPVVVDLLQKHPRWNEKTSNGAGFPGCAMLTFSSNLRPSKEIAILFADSRPAVDISWKKIVGRLNPDGTLRDQPAEKSHLEELREACRNAIRSQTLPLYREGHHVDHVFPKTFEVLLFMWVRKTGLKVTEIEILDVAGTVELGKQLKSPALKQDWQNFHAENAELEVITHEEHWSRPTLTVPWTPLL